MTKSIYISADDEDVFEHAAVLAPKQLSPLLSALLRKWVKEVDPTGSKREQLAQAHLAASATIRSARTSKTSALELNVPKNKSKSKSGNH